MSLRDEIVSTLESWPGTAGREPKLVDDVDVRAAILELQEAVVRLAEELDSRDGGG